MIFTIICKIRPTGSYSTDGARSCSHRYSRYRFVLLQCGVAYWLFLVTITATDQYGDPADYRMELLGDWKNYDGPNKLIGLTMVSFGISMWDHKIQDIDPQKAKARANDLKDAVDQGNHRVERDIGCHTKAIDRKGTFTKVTQDLPILKACGIADLVDPVSVFCAIEEHFSIEKTASETTEAKGATDEDKAVMHGFDVRTSFRKVKDPAPKGTGLGSKYYGILTKA